VGANRDTPVTAVFQRLENTLHFTSKAWKKTPQNFQRLENSGVLTSKAWNANAAAREDARPPCRVTGPVGRSLRLSRVQEQDDVPCLPQSPSAQLQRLSGACRAVGSAKAGRFALPCHLPLSSITDSDSNSTQNRSPKTDHRKPPPSSTPPAYTRMCREYWCGNSALRIRR